jgi:serine/threonine protein kinase
MSEPAVQGAIVSGATLLSGTTFAGYRLVRKLGAGSRATVYLAAGSSGSVALKVFADSVTRVSFGTEVEGLERVESPHIVRLLDVTSVGDGQPSLVFERVRGRSLASLLRERHDLERGEIVTLLAPLARVVSELQQAGVAHGKFGVGAISLGEFGQPVLMGFGHATLFTPGASSAALDTEPAAVLDRTALATLAIALLAHVRDGSRDSTSDQLSRWVTDVPRSPEFPAALEERLFDWAEPIPVAFPTADGSSSSVPSRVAVAAIAPAGSPRAPAQGITVGSSNSSDSGSDSEWVGDADGAQTSWRRWLSTVLIDDPSLELRRRVGSFVRGVRRPFWFVAAGVVTALVIAVTLLPAGSATQTTHTTDSESRSIAGSGSTSMSTPIPSSPDTQKPNPTSTASQDDPSLALSQLLTERGKCFHDRSILCLDQVDEASSSAYAEDAVAIQKLQNGGESPGPVEPGVKDQSGLGPDDQGRDRMANSGLPYGKAGDGIERRTNR